tara:strand:- start:7650 stop:8252 length:603 start_codon:yes stop_codon:yes gene_type:complete
MPEKKGRKRYQWTKMAAGDIVEFSYKGQRKNARRRYRTVLILSEKVMVQRKDGKKVRLVHGLQLRSTPRRKGSRILKEAQYSKLLRKIGRVEVREYDKTEDGLGYAISGARQTALKRYERVDALVAEYGIYRTFDYNICKRNALFLSEFQWPDNVIDQAQKKAAKKIVEAGQRAIQNYFKKQDVKPIGFKPFDIPDRLKK